MTEKKGKRNNQLLVRHPAVIAFLLKQGFRHRGYIRGKGCFFDDS